MSALPKRWADLTDKLADKVPAISGERPAHLRPVPDNGEPAPTTPTASEPGPEVQPATPGPLDKAREVAKREFTPPDIWSTDRPALSKLVAYGRHGQQVPDDGLARIAATAWAWFAALNAAIAYARQWVTERPSRTTIAVALVVLTSLVPASRAVLTALLWPAHTAIEAITDL